MRHTISRPHLLGAAYAVLLLGFCASGYAQDWRPVERPQNRWGHTFCLDPGSGELVLFGGRSEGDVAPFTNSFPATTWTWRSGVWRAGPSVFYPFTNSPEGRAGAALLPDPARGRLILVGGWSVDAAGRRIQAGDVWAYAGGQWAELSAPMFPVPRSDRTAYAYDPGRDRIVGFGNAVSSYGNETWEWDGLRWNRLAPAVSPPARRDHALAFDAVRGRTILFGGGGNAGALADTWEWDGTTWTQLRPTTSPPVRDSHTLVTDPSGGVFLFGGYDLATPLNDLWRFDGVTWTQLAANGAAAAPRLGARFPAVAAAPNGGGVVTFGGEVDANALGDLRGWSATSGWQLLAASPRPPVATRLITDLARGSLLAVSTGDNMGASTILTPPTTVWERVGEGWRELTTGGPYPRLKDAAVAGAVPGNRVLLFGGCVRTQPLTLSNATWEWNGGTGWTQLQPTVSPPPRTEGQLAGLRNGDFLLFGGVDAAGNAMGDTWIWNGVTWRMATPAVSPAARTSAAMCTDVVRGRAVLHGGFDAAGQPLNDTWEWSGLSWIQMAPTSGFPVLASSQLTYDAVRQVSSLCGDSVFASEVWDWDGATWSRAPVTRNPGRATAPFGWGFDPAAGQCVYTVGTSDRGAWELSQPQLMAGEVWYGSSCGPVGEQPYLIAQAPYLGEPLLVQVGDLFIPISGPSFFWAGASRTSWANVVLPFDLTPLGAPGCSLLAAPDVFVYAGPFGTAWTSPLCNCVSLAGTNAYLQGMVLVPNASGGFDPRLTQGVQWTFGLR